MNPRCQWGPWGWRWWGVGGRNGERTRKSEGAPTHAGLGEKYWPLPISTPCFPSFRPHSWHTPKHQLVTALGASDGVLSHLLTPARRAVISSCSLPLFLLAAFTELSLHRHLGMTTCVFSREESPTAVSQDHTQMLA